MTADLGLSMIRALARNALLANHRLHAACAQLGETEYRAGRPAFFGSIHDTLAHIHVVGLHYLALIEHGESPYEGDAPGPGFETLAALSAAQEQVDRKVLALAEGLDAAGLAAEIRYTRAAGRVCINRLADVLLHLFLHDVHHRGQVHDMLSQTGVAPPQLDEFLLTEDASLRAVEVEALGLPR